MAYASTQDLIERFGEAELIRLTTPPGQALAGVVATKSDTALGDASNVIDGYLRKRYQLPLSETPGELVSCTLALARHALALGGDRSPTEQMENELKRWSRWLEMIAAGKVDLNLSPLDAASDPSGASGARVSDRPPAFIQTEGL